VTDAIAPHPMKKESIPSPTPKTKPIATTIRQAVGTRVSLSARVSEVRRGPTHMSLIGRSGPGRSRTSARRFEVCRSIH
jgi:hypothetical protein